MSLHQVDTVSLTKALADRVRDGAVLYLPKQGETSWSWVRATSPESIDSGKLQMGKARASEPLKAILLPPRAEVSRFFDDDTPLDTTEQVVLGARQCDIASVRALDHIFLEGDFVDPFYQSRRKRTLIISTDCTDPKDVCFCTSVEGSPYPTKGFDINLSHLSQTVLAETGSEKGEQFVAQNKSAFSDAPASAVEERDKKRAEVEQQLRASLKERGYDFPGGVRHITKDREKLQTWDTQAGQCVECGSCTFACPSCHCFHLLDVEGRNGYRRFAQWDSCQFPKFAQVAGGANPRPRRAERLLNRLEKKFSFFPDTVGEVACVGCGRCIEACAGKLDIRDVIKELGR